MNALVRYARTWVWRGLRESSRPWLVAGIAAGGLEVVRRALAREPEVVYEGKLEPGERLEIRTIPPEAEQNAKAVD
jgi:hypothetical protein